VFSVVDDVAEISWITTVFLLSVVLGYLSTSIVIGQVYVFAGQRSFFTSGMLRPIGTPVTNGGLAPMVPSR
jgi:hypothetical protein